MRWRIALAVALGLIVVLFLFHLLTSPSDPLQSFEKRLASASTPSERINALQDLYRFLMERSLPKEDRSRGIDLIKGKASLDSSPEVRAHALSLLCQGLVSKDGQAPLLLKALNRSGSEAEVALQYLATIDSPAVWRLVLDRYESVKDPVLSDRYLRLLKHLPECQIADLCRRLGRDETRWAAVATRLEGAPVNLLVDLALKGDQEARLGALKLLTRFLPRQDYALKLVPLLKSQRKAIRRLTAQVLAEIPLPSLVPHFKKHLTDDPEVAAPVSRALLRLGALKPSEARKLARSPAPALRGTGVLAIARSSQPADLGLLKQMLHDPDPSVARNAAAALASRGTDGLRTVLMACRGELRGDRRAAWLEGVAGVRSPLVVEALVSALIHGGWREQAVAVSGLAFQGDDGIPHLSRLVRSPDPTVRAKAVEGLKVINTESSTRLLLDIARSASDQDLRLSALEALSSRQRSEALPLLVGLCEKGDARQAVSAASLLLRYGRRGEKALLELLKGKRHTAVLAAARALASAGNKEGLAMLWRAAEEANREDLQLLITLAKTGDRNALERLTELLASKDPVERLKGRAALFAVGVPAADRLLDGTRDARPQVRAECALILGSLKYAPAREALARLTEDPDETVRACAAQALARIREAGL